MILKKQNVLLVILKAIASVDLAGEFANEKKVRENLRGERTDLAIEQWVEISQLKSLQKSQWERFGSHNLITELDRLEESDELSSRSDEEIRLNKKALSSTEIEEDHLNLLESE